MNHTAVILKKQLKDTLKNKTIFIQFILFPVMALVMESTIRFDGMPDHFFVKLFSVMYVGMAPVTALSAIISEEKEKNTLRVLMMANVKPRQYLAGVGSYVWIICMSGAAVMGITAGFRGKQFAFYMLVMGFGILVSVVEGAAIGIFAKNQMMATSLVMPVMLLFSFLPMISLFHDKIRKFAEITYTQQMSLLLEQMSFRGMGREDLGILCLNLLVFSIFFGMAYKKNGLD